MRQSSDNATVDTGWKSNSAHELQSSNRQSDSWLSDNGSQGNNRESTNSAEDALNSKPVWQVGTKWSDSGEDIMDRELKSELNSLDGEFCIAASQTRSTGSDWEDLDSFSLSGDNNKDTTLTTGEQQVPCVDRKSLCGCSNGSNSSSERHKSSHSHSPDSSGSGGGVKSPDVGVVLDSSSRQVPDSGAWGLNTGGGVGGGVGVGVGVGPPTIATPHCSAVHMVAAGGGSMEPNDSSRWKSDNSSMKAGGGGGGGGGGRGYHMQQGRGVSPRKANRFSESRSSSSSSSNPQAGGGSGGGGGGGSKMSRTKKQKPVVDLEDALESLHSEPSGWGELPSPQPNEKDNGTEFWGVPPDMRERMIKERSGQNSVSGEVTTFTYVVSRVLFSSVLH